MKIIHVYLYLNQKLKLVKIINFVEKLLSLEVSETPEKNYNFLPNKPGLFLICNKSHFLLPFGTLISI